MPVPKRDHTMIKHWGGGFTSNDEDHDFYSSRFQWLPCEVAFHGEDSLKITSYINNLQPRKHKGLARSLNEL